MYLLPFLHIAGWSNSNLVVSLATDDGAIPSPATNDVIISNDYLYGGERKELIKNGCKKVLNDWLIIN